MNANEPMEQGHADSWALLSRLLVVRPIVILPTLAEVEIAAFLNRARGDAALASACATAIRGLTFIEWVPLARDIPRSAVTVATRCRLRRADAVYAAVALEYGCDLVSLDKEHLNRLAGVVPTLTPAALASLPPPPPSP